MEPNKENIQLLVGALRSGEFQQCKGALARQAADGSRSYCCLGVATIIAMRNGVAVEENIPGTQDCCTKCQSSIRFSHPEAAAGSTSSLIKPVQQFYGIDSADPVLRGDQGMTDRATRMNDHLGYDFAAIADAFERTYLAG